MDNTLLDPLIKQYAKKFDLDWYVVKAVCIKESSLDPWAVRYEKSYHEGKRFLNPSFYAKLNGITVATEEVLQSMSWGLMQPLGVVARECGFERSLPELCLPHNSLETGCRKLKSLIKKHGKIIDSLAAYNAGSGNIKGGLPYAMAVMSIVDELILNDK